MNSSQVDTADAIATSVTVADDRLAASLAVRREIAVPLSWYPRLEHATSDERQHWELQAGGRHIHWPDVDEDLSVEGLLAGRASAESDPSLSKWLASRRSKQL